LIHFARIVSAAVPPVDPHAVEMSRGAKPPRNRRRGFTLIEVLVASLIMGIAVSGILSGLAAASRNASRLTAYDRATLLAREQMDQLLADPKAPRNVLLQGAFDPALVGGATAGWRARVTAFEAVPGASPGRWCVDRVALEIWWIDGQTTHSFSLEGFRRGILQAGDPPPGEYPSGGGL